MTEEIAAIATTAEIKRLVMLVDRLFITCRTIPCCSSILNDTHHLAIHSDFALSKPLRCFCPATRPLS